MSAKYIHLGFHFLNIHQVLNDRVLPECYGISITDKYMDYIYWGLHTDIYLLKWPISRSEILVISISTRVRQMNRQWWVLNRFTSCLELVRDNFRNILFSIVFLYKSYNKRDFYEPQGWLIRNHHKYVVVLCSTRTICIQKKLSPISRKISLCHIYLRMTQLF